MLTMKTKMIKALTIYKSVKLIGKIMLIIFRPLSIKIMICLLRMILNLIKNILNNKRRLIKVQSNNQIIFIFMIIAILIIIVVLIIIKIILQR